LVHNSSSRVCVTHMNDIMARLVEGGCNISIPRKFFPINVHVTYSNHPENVSYMLKTTQNPLATTYQQPQNHVGKCFPVKYHLLWRCFSAMQCCSRDQLILVHDKRNTMVLDPDSRLRVRLKGQFTLKFIFDMF